MKVIIKIDEDLEKVKKAFQGENITIVKTQKEKKKLLEAIFKKYRIKLPANYKFKREEIPVR